MMNLKGLGRKRWWDNRGIIAAFYGGGVRKTTKDPSQNSLRPGRVANPAPPEYISRQLPQHKPVRLLVLSNHRLVWHVAYTTENLLRSNGSLVTGIAWRN
jgi:hypothetical protein